MTTPILKIPEAADGQVNQYLVLNEGLRALESSGNEFYEVDLSAGNVTLTDVSPGYIFSRNFMFKATGNAVARILTVPASKRLFAVQNGGSAELTVKCGATEIAVPAAGSFMFYGDGTTDGLYLIAGGDGGSGGGPSAFDPVVAESGTTRTAASSDAGKYIRFTNSGAVTYTIAPQADVAWGDDVEITVRRAANEGLTLSAGSGVTLNPPSGGTYVLSDRMTVVLKRIAADVWDIIGQTEPTV